MHYQNLSKIILLKTKSSLFNKQKNDQNKYNQTRMNPEFKLGSLLDDRSTVSTSSRVFTIAGDRSTWTTESTPERFSGQDLVFPREKAILKRGHKLLIPARGPPRGRRVHQPNRCTEKRSWWLVLPGFYGVLVTPYDSRVKWHGSRNRLLVTDY